MTAECRCGTRAYPKFDPTCPQHGIEAQLAEIVRAAVWEIAQTPSGAVGFLIEAEVERAVRAAYALRDEEASEAEAGSETR